MITDALEPNRHQAISNHHADYSVTKEYHSGPYIILCSAYIAFTDIKQTLPERGHEVRNPWVYFLLAGTYFPSDNIV